MEGLAAPTPFSAAPESVEVLEGELVAPTPDVAWDPPSYSASVQPIVLVDVSRRAAPK